jgi:hypothetical protein
MPKRGAQNDVCSSHNFPGIYGLNVYLSKGSHVTPYICKVSHVTPYRKRFFHMYLLA